MKKLKGPMRRLGILTALFSLLATSVSTFAQNPGTGSTVVPMPGVGHDYVKAISETVDPGSGSVSLRIAVPMPQGRGLTLPFSFAYDSNGVFFPPAWKPFVTGFMSSGGWSYTIPAVGSDNGSYTAPGTQVTCGYNTNYRFVDGAGARRELRLFVMLGTNPACGGSYNVWSSRDITTQSVYSPASGVQVVDADGTIYNFSGGSYGGIARLIEDRNGNQINVTTSGTSGAFTETDTLGRPVLSSSGFGTTGNTVAVSGLGAPYTLTWESPSYNFTIGSALVYNGNNYACSFTGSTSGSRSVVKSIQLPDGQSYSFKYGTDDPNNSNPYGLISQVTYPSGGWIKYSWGGNPQSAGGVFPNLQGQVGQCFWRWGKPVILTRTISFDGVNAAQKQTYQYSTAWGSTGNAQSYLWSSKTTTVTTQDLIRGTSFVTTYLYAAADSGEPTPVAPPVGGSYTVETQIPVEQTITHQDVGGSTVETVNKTWYNAQQLQSEQDTFGSAPSQKKFTYGLGGVLTEEDEFDFGQTTATRKTINTYQPFTATPIFSSLPSILDKPCKTIIYDSGGNAAAETDYYYDGGTSLCASTTGSALTGTGSYTAHDETFYGTGATVARGNVTQKVEWLSGGTSPTTKYTYDETGQVLSLKDPCGNSTCADVTGTAHTTTYSYADSYSSGTPPSASNAYVTTITHPAVNGVTTHNYYQYAYSDGQLTSSQDDNDKNNGTSTSYVYNDNLRRLTQTNYPDGGQTTYTYNDTPYTSGGLTPNVTTTRLMSSGTSRVTVGAMDGMGHPRKTKLTSDPDGATYTRTSYDGLGRVYQQWNPTRCDPDTNPASCSGETTYGITTNVYDALSRIKTATEPNGGMVATNYGGITTQVIDEGNGTSGVQHLFQTDAFGRQQNDCEITSVPLLGGGGTPASCGFYIAGTGFATGYTHDVLGNLTAVGQSAVYRTFQYDSLSRLTSATNPESGTTTYSYDANSNLYQRTRPAPNVVGTSNTVTTTYQYDALNRLISTSYSDGSTPSVNLGYDEASPMGVAATNQIGRITSKQVYNSNNQVISAEIFPTYDSMGRVLLNEQCTPVTCGHSLYTFSHTYDLAGDEITSSNGLGVTLTSNYSAAGRLSTFTSNLSDANHPGTLLSALHYSPFGSTLSDTLGAAITEFSSYTNRGWIDSYKATGIYSFNIWKNGNSATTGYAPNGDILYSNDAASGAWSYTYDDFNRLATSNCTTNCPNGTAAQGFNYVYDRFGNRWQQNVTVGSGPQPQFTFDANNHIVGLTYDAAGNVLFDGTNHYTYDGESRLLTVYGNASASYMYDADGRRMKKNNGTSTVYFLNDLSGHEIAELSATGGWNRGEVYGGGRHLATYSGGTSGTTYFALTDWLGTERARVLPNGTVSEACTNLPFGDGQVCTGTESSPLHFTGKERDAESGLDYFGARYDASSMGRFMTPDEPFIDQQARDPQSWNLYSYVRNNPLNNTDPTGNACVDGKDDDQGGETCAQVAASDATYLKDGKASATVTAEAPLNDFALAVFSQPVFNNAAGFVNAAGTLEMNILAPWAGALAGCTAGGSKTSCGANMALALLPDVAALKEGATLLKAGRGLHAAEVLEKAGGFAQAAKDFESLKGAERTLGDIKVKDLADGSKAVVREFSRDGRPTLEIQHASGEVTKYRYN